jgi:hypothetical protein
MVCPARGRVICYETITLGSNVIRFPIELRAKPSIDLLVEVAPDSREVELIACNLVCALSDRIEGAVVEGRRLVLGP